MSLCINPRCSQPNHPGNDASRFCQSCGAGLVLQNRYRVMRLLSDKSGFGRVYEAYERNTPKLLKVLKERHNDNPKAVELFEQEALVLSRLRHPGIPMVEEDGCFQLKPTEDSEPLHCIIMEKIDGLNLSEWMRQQGGNPIGEKQAVNWLQQLAKILNLVHQENFFHRDIKPENIMLRSSGQLVLVDFGAAREMTYTYYEQLGATGGITKVSSAGYTPPEQERGQAVPQSDFYALGCTFLFLLTGKTPTDPSIYDSLNNEFQWRHLAPQISPELSDFIDCMTSARASERPQSTEDLLDQVMAIAQIIESRPSHATPNVQSHSAMPNGEHSPAGQYGANVSRSSASSPSSVAASNRIPPGSLQPGGSAVPQPPSQTGGAPPNTLPVPDGTLTQAPPTTLQAAKRKQRRLWTGGIAVALIAAGGIGVWGISRLLPPPAPVEADSAEPYTLADTLSNHSESVSVLALSPDQQTLASGSDDTTVVLWDMVDRQLGFILEGHQNPMNALAFTPNSRYLASGGDDLYITIWDTETGEAVQTLDGHSKSVNDLAFSSDGNRLISASADETIKVWDWPSGEVLMTLSGHRGFVNAIALSPDGRTLVSGGTDTAIKLWDMETAEEKGELLGHTSFVNAIAISPDGQRVGSASADTKIKIWNINTGTEIRSLDAHNSYVNELIFTPDGRNLVSSSADQTIKIWDQSTGDIEAHIPWSGTFIDAIAIKYEGPTWQVIAGGKGSNDIQIWQLTR